MKIGPIKNSGCHTVIATALPDRLLHHAHVMHVRGQTYRLKNRLKGRRSDRSAGGDPGGGATGDVGHFCPAFGVKMKPALTLEEDYFQKSISGCEVLKPSVLNFAVSATWAASCTRRALSWHDMGDIVGKRKIRYDVLTRVKKGASSLGNMICGLKKSLCCDITTIAHKFREKNPEVAL